MKKVGYRIGDLAKYLNVKKFVIRFWEKELQIAPKRSKGGQRFYQESDFKIFCLVKELLYTKKYTLAGAKEELQRLKSVQKTKIIATQKTSILISQQTLLTMKEKLLFVREKLS